MEPISTLVLTAAFLAAAPATRKPSWELELFHSQAGVLVEGKSTTILLGDIPGALQPQTEIRIDTRANAQSGILSPRELLKREVSAYSDLSDGWNGDGSVPPSGLQLQIGLQFAEGIPAHLPLPRPMLSSMGEFGFYWDLEGGYAEFSIEADGRGTFFSRDRAGKERFQEDLAIEDLRPEWFWTSLGSLDQTFALAA